MLFGDLNYRLYTDLFNARKLISMQDYEELMKYDELKDARKECDVLQNFKESTILFDPTYKYSLNSTDYEAGGKVRVPAWCDRILYDAENNLT